jgi:hypothetical protein
MIPTRSTSIRSLTFRTALLALSCALTVGLTSTAKAATDGTPALQPLNDTMPAMPLVVSFDKVTGAEGGPYVLKLKNTSSDALTVSATVFPSVTIHSDTKERTLPDQVIAAGDTWSIPGLAATDKVTINSKGFAHLDITVP